MRQNKKKKVLVLLPVFDLGGAEKQAFYIARSLQESGLYDVQVWALLKGSGLLLAQLDKAGLKCEILNIPFSTFHNALLRIRAYFNFFCKIWSHNFDVIIPFTYHCNVLAASVFRFAGVKKNIWFQIAMEYGIELSTFEKIAVSFKPIYAANSQAAAEFIANKHALSRNQVHFVPNPFEKLEPKSTAIQWREKLGAKKEDIVFVMAANFFPEKDHETLLRGLKILLGKNPQLMLVFAGGPIDGNRAYQLKALAFDLKLPESRIKFLGSIDDVPGLLNASQIGILSTRSEGSPNCLIEYMGYGLPIIATNIPPITELLGIDYPYLFAIEDENDFVAKTEKLLLNRNNLQLLINKNKEKITSIYTKENNYLAFHELLQR